MADEFPETVQLTAWLARMRAGDKTAREAFLGHVCERLRRLTRKMLKGYPGVQRWAQTDDVLQNALLRLLRALDDVEPTSTREFLGLAATQIRRELLDLARHFYGPHGTGANYSSRTGEPAGSAELEPPAPPDDPGNLAAWGEFHERIGQLPAEERETLDLLYYQGLSQTDAAGLLGVSVRTVQRRWQSALLKLHDLVQGSLLEL
jgi:RNA polymerase sigma-70 factor (ECF subfamily)